MRIDWQRKGDPEDVNRYQLIGREEYTLVMRVYSGARSTVRNIFRSTECVWGYEWACAEHSSSIQIKVWPCLGRRRRGVRRYNGYCFG